MTHTRLLLYDPGDSRPLVIPVPGGMEVGVIGRGIRGVQMGGPSLGRSPPAPLSHPQLRKMHPLDPLPPVAGDVGVLLASAG
jgi:hypothetical protein